MESEDILKSEHFTARSKLIIVRVVIPSLECIAFCKSNIIENFPEFITQVYTTLPTISNDAVVEPQTSEDVLNRNKSIVGSADVLYATVISISKNGKYEIAFNNQPGNPGLATFRFGFAATCGRKNCEKAS
jgi:hypothetical protein